LSIVEKSDQRRSRVPSLGMRATQSNLRGTSKFQDGQKPLIDPAHKDQNLDRSNMSLGNTEYSYSIAKGTSIMNNLPNRKGKAMNSMAQDRDQMVNSFTHTAQGRNYLENSAASGDIVMQITGTDGKEL
jgi:hypothetical protein